MFYGFGEEGGWLGFAQPRLQEKRSALTATLVLSPLWALWHLPLFWALDGYMQMGVVEVVGWLISTPMGRILFTWLYNSTNGSILIAATLHGTADIMMTSRASDPSTVAAMSMLLMASAAVVLIATGPTNLSRAFRQTLPLGPADRQ